MTTPFHEFLHPMRELHVELRQIVVDACESQSIEALSGIAREDDSDTQFVIDELAEAKLIQLVEKHIASRESVILIAEGLNADGIALPRGIDAAHAAWRLIIDPIDGTREIMYQKRSAWILSGLAPNLGETTNLGDIELAVQSEIPLVKQHLQDVLWAVRGAGAGGERQNRLTDETLPLQLRPSSASSISQGFAMVSRFFPGARDELAAIDEEIVAAALGPIERGKTHCFEDQYISNGGQLYELIVGHDRFIADLRPLMEPVLERRGTPLGVCAHPYDLCTELIAREAGVQVVDPRGRPLDAPLDTVTEVAWVGYANKDIQGQMEPLLRSALERRSLI